MKTKKVWITVYDNGYAVTIISKNEMDEDVEEKLVFRTKAELTAKLEEIL